ncbi:MAG: FAD-binding oxidoreductase [Muribaculaceae bacterium]|nr:FAD-binding oxidoreductase [Muribaculaceae bacterium]
MKRFLDEIKSILPSDSVYTDELRTLAWGTDASFYRLTPQVVIRARDEAEVSTVVKIASKYGLPFTFRAAGTSLSGQSVSDSILIVAGKNWEDYSIAEDASSITLQPGIVGARVNQILKPLGRVFPPDPASIGSAMVGGIVANNASGMNCGTHANSDRMLLSARLVLPDGTVLDTGDKASREAFKQSHPDFIAKIESLRDRIRANQPLADRIRKKYSIKNVTGLNLRHFIAYDDPFDIIAHCVVGSEGTLAFISQVTMRTLHDYPCKASAMLYFFSMRESCEAVVALKQLKSSDADITMSEENLMVKSAEMLDYLSLASVDDPVFLQYKRDVDAGLIQGVVPGDYRNLTAILTETKAVTPEDLQHRINTITDCLSRFKTYIPVEFTTDPAVYGKYWAIRSGIFPSVGGARPVGTSCLIEDVAFAVEDLPEATVKLQRLIANHGYKDACIYGHAFEGNYHFIINQLFSDESEVQRYAAMMRDVARLVVEEYDGSLKAEHGTGRNMAPFVKYEWGEEAFAAMRELKEIFDPHYLLNPGVIFNDDPECFIKHFKPLPEIKMQGLDESIPINKCIECGFCEVNCVTCGFTLSSRQRIVIQREISHLRETGHDPERLATLLKQYRYQGNQTCAGDGLCATSCPMGINVADLTHLVRQQALPQGSIGYKTGDFAARHFAGIKSGLRLVLDTARLGHNVLGSQAMNGIAGAMHKAGLPLWTPAMPGSARQPRAGRVGEGDLKVVYFPSCINQTMGLSKGAPVKNTLVDEMVQLCNKAGYEVIFPEGLEKMCCGTIWESKGMLDIADRKTAELDEALWQASEHGKYPVVCDQSPCLHRMRKCIKRLHLYEPVEFIWDYLRAHLEFTPIDRHVALHFTCSTREMGLVDKMTSLARLCSNNVFLPEGVGCCGFAGDRGWTYPEVNRWALRKLRRQLEANRIEMGYSNSRTCEVGLQTNGGIPYQSIVYLVNETTKPKTN